MKELVRTDDLALISYIEALLNDARIHYVIADAHMSALSGAIGPVRRRILVEVDRESEARRLLANADLARELRPPRK